MEKGGWKSLTAPRAELKKKEDHHAKKTADEEAQEAEAAVHLAVVGADKQYGEVKPTGGPLAEALLKECTLGRSAEAA